MLVNFEDMPEITSDGSKVKEVCMIPSHTSKTGKLLQYNRSNQEVLIYLHINVNSYLVDFDVVFKTFQTY